MSRTRPALLLAGLALGLAACGTPAPGSPAPSEAVPTAVPGGSVDGSPTPIPTTVLESGAILDVLPAAFPLYPGAEEGDIAEGPVSGSFLLPADAATASAWYADELGARGYAVEVSAPLEGGQLVLDARDGACAIQISFRPEAPSTIMLVRYGAACAR